MKFQGGQIVSSHFIPNQFLKNQHTQTLWPTLFRIEPMLQTKRERLITPDKDFIDIDWLERSQRPLILLIHGLASSANAKYIKGLQIALEKNGFASVAINLRSCSGEPNLKSNSYHGGVSEDLDFVLQTLRTRFPERPIGAVGFSLGANVLLKWLSEVKSQSTLFGAISVSAPLQLNLATEQLQKGFSNLYGQYLLSFMKWNHYKKITHFKKLSLTEELEKLKKTPSLWKIKNIADFDEHITAPLHGFQTARDYYQTNSARPLLKFIQTPTLIIHAKDDPFMPSKIIPSKEELSPFVMLEISENGGHVGFIGKSKLNLPHYWLEERIPFFFKQNLDF